MHGIEWSDRDPAWAAITSDAVEVAGVRAHVLHTGALGAPAATAGTPGRDPVLLLHGLGGFAGSWAEVLPPLGRHGPVVAVDLPGFGATAPAHRHDARPLQLAAFVVGLLDTLGWDRVELHGNSMGGMVATLVAAEHPDRVSRVVLAAPALPAPRSAAWRVPRQAIAQFAPFAVPGLGELALKWRIRRSSPDALVRESFDAIWGDPASARDSIVDLSIANSRYGLTQEWRIPSFAAATEELVRLLSRPRRLDAAVDELQPPTLVVWGDRDTLVTRPVIDGLRGRRGDWVYEVLDGVGHQPHLEAPDRYLAAVDRWRERVTATARLQASDTRPPTD